MPLTPGTRVGAYEITGAIGAGGMGEVYRARDPRLNRDVAIKVLPSLVGDDPDRLARFRREAQVLASLNHPNIATVHGFEDADGVRALVMELVPGATLDQLRPSLDESLTIARQIAEALEAAHDQGIVHRDLKPANVKVRDDGTVKVLDFGLAKAMDPGTSGATDVTTSPTLTARATQLGVILGTAAYMSPEQAKGKPVDRRTDIWAFGVVLYEMLSGRRGYEAEDVADTLAAVLTRDVDWAALPADTPPRIQMLLRDCLVRDPKQRLRDIGEARRAIEQVLSGTSATSVGALARPIDGPSGVRALSPAAPSHARLTRMLPWAIAALATLAAAVLGLQALRPAAAPAAIVTRSRIAFKDLAGFVAVSRDGTKVAYTITGGARGFMVALRHLDQFEGKAIPGSEGGLFPVFSPDGQSIAFSSDLAGPGKIRTLAIGGGTSVAVSDGSFTDGADWGDDDTLVFRAGKGLKRVTTTGGTPQDLTTIDAAKGETAHVRPQFLPGGTQLLFTVISSSPESPHFAVLDLQKGGYRTVARGGLNGRYAPSGHLTFVRDATLFAVPFDLKRLAVTGPEVAVVEAISSAGPVGTADYAFSRSGTLVYAEGLAVQGTTLSWSDRKGNVTPIPGQVPRKWGNGYLSPDGRRVAMGLDSDKGRDIWIMDLERATPHRLTFGGRNDWPLWTSDGQRVIYGGAPADGSVGLYVVPADGSAPPALLFETKTMPVPTSITARDTTVLYRQLDQNNRARVWVLGLAGNKATGDPRPLRDGSAADSDARVSPDGKWVAFTSAETGSPEVYLMPFPGPGGRTRVSAAGGRDPRWSRDGRELFFRSPDAGIAPTYVVAVQTSPALSLGIPAELFRMVLGSTWGPAPDGKLLIETLRSAGDVSSIATVTHWFDELKRRAPAKK